MPWDIGGTLHDATIEEWRAASARNRLATAADWAATLLEGEALDWESADDRLRSLRPLAEQLVACADTAPTVSGDLMYRVANRCWSKLRGRPDLWRR